MRDDFAKKQDSLTTESPYDDFLFQLCCLLKSVSEGAERKYREHSLLDPEQRIPW
jgi:hypothetical protein